MRRYRRRSHRRKPQNVVWQRVTDYASLVFNNKEAGEWTTGSFLTNITPGVGLHDSRIEPFDDQMILERARGHIAHVTEATGSNTGNDILPFSIGFLKVPVEFTVNSDNNIMDTSDGDDFFIFGNHVCGEPISVNVDRVDNKAKRRFEPGDVIKVLWAVQTPVALTGSNQIVIRVVYNLSFLWKLRN